jgi:hypothetical protein
LFLVGGVTDSRYSSGALAQRRVAKADRRDNLYPTKQRSDQKIDATVALVMMAIGR